MRGPAHRLDRTVLWKSLVVAIIGLAAPVFVSTPLSATDTHGASSMVKLQPLAAERR